MMHIAIDGNEANQANRVGSNVYAFEILAALAELTAQAEDVTVTVLLSRQPLEHMPKEQPFWQYRVVRPTLFWTQWALPIHLFFNQNKYDVLFTPGHYAPRISAIPYISSVMDLAFLIYPSYFKERDLIQLKAWTNYSVKNATKVVAISEHTKKDIIKHYGKDPEDIVVAYPATHTLQKSSSAIISTELEQLGINAPFFLHLGTLQPRKNIIRIIEAFEQTKRAIASGKINTRRKRYQKLDQLKLVLAGKEGWLAEPIMKRISSSPNIDDIVITGFINEQAKVALLAECEAVIMASFYEGFGIPALEALSIGTIPIAANNTSLPEVVGTAGILIDPFDTHSLYQGLEKCLLLTTKDRAQLRKKAREQIKKFSWKTSAIRIFEELQRLTQK